VNAVKDLLPREVVHRPKRGFTLPFKHWFRDQLRPSMEQQFRGWEDGPLEPYVEARAVRRVWSAFLDGRTSWSRPWALYVLNQWCTANLEQASLCAAEVAS
jgi:asparagine synthase (glutamine-hydrolysing)